MTRPAAVLLAVTLALTGCTTAPEPGPSASGTSTGQASSPADIDSYVALGDSFTAGPLVPTTQLAGGCLRSDGNYPSLVARRLHVRSFTDVSCSSATTHDLTHPQHPFGDAVVPPQLRAVRPGTDLVTPGIGGNDFDLYGTLVSTCTRMRPSDPTGSPCADALAQRHPGPAAVTRRIGQRVARMLRAVEEKAPHARVLLVGYLRVAPRQGRCPRLLPLADGDYAEVRSVERLLNRALADAAHQAGADFVDLYAASRGHDVCAVHPWVNGQLTRRDKALAYHPLPAGMRAAARQVLATLRGS